MKGFVLDSLKLVYAFWIGWNNIIAMRNGCNLSFTDTYFRDREWLDGFGNGMLFGFSVHTDSITYLGGFDMAHVFSTYLSRRFTDYMISKRRTKKWRTKFYFPKLKIY